MPETVHGNLVVSLAENAAERAAVHRFRYRVLVAYLGEEPDGTDHGAGEVRDAFDIAAQQLVLRQQGEIVAAIRLCGGGTAPLPVALDSLYRLDRFAPFGRRALSMTDRLVLAPEHGRTEAALLIAAAYKTARRHGSRFDFTCCTPALVRLYEQLGYRRYAEPFVDAESGYRLPMVLLTEDLAYLRTARSPLAAIAAGYPNRADTAIWFAGAFPDHAGLKAEPVHDEDRFWRHLCDTLKQSPTVGIPLFAGMAFRDVRRFLKIGTILQVGRGELILRAGSRSEEMYIVLAGAAEARIGSQPVAAFGRGETFGELAFLSAEPRTADVVATDPVEVLVLTQDYLKRAMAAMPEIAAQVLFNLSLILTRRLKDATRSWIAAAGQAA
jgi:hypothetical protein